jgi:hypothetical protein
MTLSPPRSYMPKAAVGGLDDYHCFLLEPHLSQDAYVTSARDQAAAPDDRPSRDPVRSGRLRTRPRRGAQRERRAATAGPASAGRACRRHIPARARATSTGSASPPWIAAWVPGHANNDLPEGTGVLVHAGAAIVMQVHYNLIHKAQRDRSRAVIRFAPAATTKLTPLNTILVPAPVELPCPRSVQSTLCSRDVAVQQEIKKYGYKRGADPVRPALHLRQVARRLSAVAVEREVVATSCDRRVTRPAPHLRRRRPHAHPRLRHPDRAQRQDAAAHPALELPLAGRVLPREAGRREPGDVIHVSCKFDNSAVKQPLVNGRL